MKGRILVAAAALALAACSNGSSPRPTATASDADALAEIDQHLETSQSSCFVVVRGGKTIHEAYWNGGSAKQELPAYSVTKSFTSLLVGIAADEGLLDLDDSAADYISAWKGTPAEAVTIRDLLSNTSGRHWDFSTDYTQMALSVPDKTDFAIKLAQDHQPGTVWAYNNSAVQTLSAILLKATGQEPADYARTKLLEPLGMKHTTWAADQAGHSTTFAGVSSTCEDLARLGQMMLDGGERNGAQIVPEQYVKQATGRSSSDLNAAYGLLWWVNQRGTVLGSMQATNPQAKTTSAPDTRLAPHAPGDAFWAVGYGSQVLAVVPSLDLVAVRMGGVPADPTAVTPDRFTGDLVEALKR